MNVQDRAESCIVRLVEDGGQKRSGTGFFVAPGYILTCAHVVQPLPDELPRQFKIESRHGEWQAVPQQWQPRDQADLALLAIASSEHPCVLFCATAEPLDRVWTQGYVSRQKEIRLEPALGEIEGERRARLEESGPEYTLIKFHHAQIMPGMSGSPLVNLRTGGVCGIVARTLNEQTDAGGLAFPLRTILACYPFISDLQTEYHRRHNDWRVSSLLLPSPDLTEADKLHIIATFPPGPAVLLSVVPMDLITAFYGLTATDSAVVVGSANNLRVGIDRSIKPFLISLVDLPNPELGVVKYWMAAFTQAAARGPRMLTALLYEAPFGTFTGLEDKLRELLATLRTWPIA